MVYVDAFGEVSPCVFTPMSFGNLRERPLDELVAEMASRMAPGQHCWLNRNYRVLQEVGGGGEHLLDHGRALEVLSACPPVSAPKFYQLLPRGGSCDAA
jgi:hypothetical protein